jgi:hypothetical protein
MRLTLLDWVISMASLVFALAGGVAVPVYNRGYPLVFFEHVGEVRRVAEPKRMRNFRDGTAQVQ